MGNVKQVELEDSKKNVTALSLLLLQMMITFLLCIFIILFIIVIVVCGENIVIDELHTIRMIIIR